MKKTDLAYIAGIIDGEGCIRITIDGSHYRHSRMYISVASTDQWLIQYLRMAFDGHIYSKHLEHRKASWEWVLGGESALIFLQAILPYLYLKRPQAEIAIQFQERKIKYRNQHHGIGCPKTDKIWAVEQAESILLSKMKQAKI